MAFVQQMGAIHSPSLPFISAFQNKKFLCLKGRNENPVSFYVVLRCLEYAYWRSWKHELKSRFRLSNPDDAWARPQVGRQREPVNLHYKGGVTAPISSTNPPPFLLLRFLAEIFQHSYFLWEEWKNLSFGLKFSYDCHLVDLILTL